MPDDFDSAVADRFKLLDHVRVPDTWSRVQLKVLDNRPASDTWSPTQFTEEVVTMIDVKTTDPAEPRQKRPMRVVVAGILAAAAAVVAVAFVVIRDADDVTPADEPSSTATVPPTTAPRALPKGPLLPNTPSKQTTFVPGTYFIDSVNGTPTPRIFVTLGAGWTDTSNAEGDISLGRIGYMWFSRIGKVFADACHPSNGLYPGPVATVDGVVAALREQQGGWVDVTTPADISIDGYAGKAFQRTAPADMSACSTRFGRTRTSTGQVTFPDFRSWPQPDGLEGRAGGSLPYEPGQIETLWVLDLDGTIIVISTELWPGPSAVAHADFAAAELDSIRIARE
jgi:hypothetical protein